MRVIVTADPAADIGGDARAALEAPRFPLPGDIAGPVSIEIPEAHLASQTPVGQVEEWLDLQLPHWRERLSVVVDDG